MATAKPGDPGQVGTYDPKTGGKFEPTTKAEPPPEEEPGRHYRESREHHPRRHE